jgi:hypothetical protein
MFNVFCILRTLDVFFIKLHKYPIFSAVSSLSPVSIQTFIPASIISFRALGTPSYSLSSNAVAPSISNPISISFSNFFFFIFIMFIY